MTFFDIFSKKDTLSTKGEVIVDSRESKSSVYLELKKLGLDVKFEPLEIADYLVNGISIERKTVSDFKSSITNKRIFLQLDNLMKYEKPLMIIEGIQNEDIYSGTIHENAFRGMILSVLFKYEIPIVYTKDERDTARYIAVLALKKDKQDLSARYSRSNLSDDERVKFILEGFLGIGPSASMKLIQRFGNLRNIFNASLQELEQVLGKRAHEFFRLVNL